MNAVVVVVVAVVFVVASDGWDGETHLCRVNWMLTTFSPLMLLML